MVTRNGRPSFVLMSPDDPESLEETLDIVRDDELMESLRRSREEADQGMRLRLGEHPEQTEFERPRIGFWPFQGDICGGVDQI